jgi:hypothetical protein
VINVLPVVEGFFLHKLHYFLAPTSNSWSIRQYREYGTNGNVGDAQLHINCKSSRFGEGIVKVENQLLQMKTSNNYRARCA